MWSLIFSFGKVIDVPIRIQKEVGNGKTMKRFTKNVKTEGLREPTYVSSVIKEFVSYGRGMSWGCNREVSRNLQKGRLLTNRLREKIEF